MSAEDAVMLTDRLLSVLREAARPMSTAELAELMPWEHERTAHGGCQWWCDRDLHGGVRLLECHGGWHLIAFKRTAHGFNGIYRHLRALEQRGLVRRDGGDASPRVYWSYCADDGRPAAVGALYALETLIAADTPATPDEMTVTAILSIADSMLRLLRVSLDAMSDPELTNTAAQKDSQQDGARGVEILREQILGAKRLTDGDEVPVPVVDADDQVAAAKGIDAVATGRNGG
jgi:hypothetical protein